MQLELDMEAIKMNIVQEGSKVAPELTRKRKREAMRAITIRVPKTALDKIEATIAEVQGQAHGRAPERSQVLTWMLTQVKADDLRDRITAWNSLFE